MVARGSDFPIFDGPAIGPAIGPANARDRGPIAAFVRFDLQAAIAGVVLLACLNGILVRVAAIWIIMPSLLVLVGALVVAERQLSAGRLLGPLALLTGANWLVAITVAVVLPFMWPVMVVTAIMPVVLVTPYLDRRRLVLVIVGSGLTVVVSAALGLLNDDGGAVPDLVDWAEVVLVIGGLGALVVPCGLIVWHVNQVQLDELQAVAALNAELVRAQAELLASRRRVVDAADGERRRIERDLHDGAQQRLVALGVGLRLLRSQTADRPEINQSVAELAAEADRAVEEVRELANGIYSPVLRSQGLPGALRAAARRSPSEVRFSLAEVDRLDPSVETALYFVALEALTNAAKHAPEATVELTLERVDDGVGLVVTDHGPGFDRGTVGRSHGLANMGDRLAAVGGRLTIDTAPGRGTTVNARVPID